MINPASKDRLEKMHTRELLLLLEKSRRCGGRWCFGGDPNHASRDTWAFADDLKEILATREHIPNKAERKQILAKKSGIQKKRGNGWRKFNETKRERRKRVLDKYKEV